MAHRDLNSFLRVLDRKGELLRLNQSVSPRLEGAAVLRGLEERQGPAVQFRKLKGHPGAALGNLLSTRRRLELALLTEGDHREVVAARLGKRISPKKISTAPVQEVVQRKGIDLSRLLPVFTYHQFDAGPYITSGILMYRNPVNGRLKLGIHRMQIQKRNQLSVQIVGPSLTAWLDQSREPLPLAVVLGVEPGLLLGSVLQTGSQVDRLEAAGGLRGGAVEVVNSLTLDLPVPAGAEMVLEGRILTGKKVPEGPMGESTGVYTTSQSYLIEITTVSHRENYLYHALLPWSRDEESLRTIAYTVPMEVRLKEHDPAIERLHLVPATCATHAVISLRKQRPSHARDVIALSFGLFPVMKQLVVVDEDIDPEDEQMVTWALATRFQADRDLIVLPLTSGFAIDPSARRKDGSFLTTRIGLDATMPLGDRSKFRRIDVGNEARDKARRILSSL